MGNAEIWVKTARETLEGIIEGLECDLAVLKDKRNAVAVTVPRVIASDTREAALRALTAVIKLEAERDRLAGECARLRGIAERGAKWLDEMSSADGSGHSDLARILRRALASEGSGEESGG